jgi:hypothetical protein
MNDEFPPLQLPQPIQAKRRAARPHQAPLSPELLNRRAEVARVLGVKVAALSQALRRMTDEERHAIFYKLEHDAPVDLTGTGLKTISHPTSFVTLAIPREDNLDKLAQKIATFGSAPVKKGHVPNETLARLTEIGPGDPKDRLSDELFAQYDALVKKTLLICEIEILSLQQGRNQQRQEIRSILAELQQAFAGGTRGTLFEHEEIRGTCRAVIRCTGKLFQSLVEDRSWWRKISWFEARPRFETFHTIYRDFSVAQLGPISSPPPNAPVVCIVDSGVTVGNPFLQPVTQTGLVRSFLRHSPTNPYDEHGHGSGVASLAAYYALNLEKGAANQGRVWIASARVLGPDNQVEDERLFSVVLREVAATFVPVGVRIFVLAVGDVDKQWNTTTRRTVPRNSWIARTIDQLSREHDIVFVTCVGNLSLQDIREQLAQGQQYPTYLRHQDSRILDPGQAALALTVGSIASGTLVVSSNAQALAEQFQPSPFTRSGPGIRGEIKPELVDFGGNLVVDHQGGWVRENLGTNVVMASHQLTPAIAIDQGSSYAAPRVAHKLALILKDLQDQGLAHVSSALLKAFAVNSATYRGDNHELQTIRDQLDTAERSSWLHVVGYGCADHSRATYCDDHSAVLYYQGEIPPNTVAYFDVPVPACLQESEYHKRMTVTVVHTPEVQRWGLERYLGTDLKWRMFRGDIDREEIIAAMSVQEDGSLGDAATESEADAVPFPKELPFRFRVNRRSRGVVQHDVFEWLEHREEYSGNNYTLAVAAYEKWHRRQAPPVPLAVVIRIEDTGQAASVYLDIQRILVELEVQPRLRGPA